MKRLRKTLCILVGLVLLGCSAARGQDDPRSMMSLARKQAALAKGEDESVRSANLKKAIELYLQVPAKWPDARIESAKAYLLAAGIEKRLKNDEAAAAHYKNAAAIPSATRQKAEALTGLAGLCRRKKDPEGASSHLKRLLEECSGEDRFCARARLSLGALARDAQQHLTAIKHAESVLENHPRAWRENVDAAQLYLSILIKNRRWSEARSELKNLEQKLLERFGATEKAGSVERALQKLPARRMLTPLPVENA